MKMYPFVFFFLSLSFVQSKFSVLHQYINYHTIRTSPSFGLTVPNWQRILEREPNGKILLFLRHGYGKHNALQKQIGWKAFTKYNHASYYDPPLTHKGRQEAQRAKKHLQTQCHQYDLRIEYIISSATMRTLETFSILYPSKCRLKYEIRDDCRDQTRLYVSDRRSSMKRLNQRFPFIKGHAPSIHHNYDKRNKCESQIEMKQRVERFLTYIMTKRSERVILIITHHSFIIQVAKSLGIKLSSKPPTGGFVPIVLSK